MTSHAAVETFCETCQRSHPVPRSATHQAALGCAAVWYFADTARDTCARSMAVEILEWLNFDTSLDSVQDDIEGVATIINSRLSAGVTLTVDQRRLEIALGYIKRAANRELPKLPCRVEEMTEREVAIFNVGAAAVGNLQFIARELDALPAASPVAPQLHWPFAAKHDNCAECAREYEPPPRSTVAEYNAPVALVEQSDELVDEVQHRMDQVVEAAVEWHQAGREGGEWFEAAEKLGAAINSLLELRDGPQSRMPRRWCSVHNREEFKYESLEHELHAAPAPSAATQDEAIACQRCGKLGGKVVSFRYDSITISRWVCPHCLDATTTEEGAG